MALLSKEQLYGRTNIPIVGGLFFELTPQNRQENVVFTLNPHKKDKYIFLQDIYVEMCEDDPSEYEFAMYVFGEMEAWERIKAVPRFAEHYEKWVRYADIKRKSKAFKAIIGEVQNEGRSKFSAAKMLIDEPWKPKRKKADKEKSRETTEEAFSQHRDDIERLKENGLIN